MILLIPSFVVVREQRRFTILGRRFSVRGCFGSVGFRERERGEKAWEERR